MFGRYAPPAFLCERLDGAINAGTRSHSPNAFAGKHFALPGLDRDNALIAATIHLSRIRHYSIDTTGRRERPVSATM